MDWNYWKFFSSGLFEMNGCCIDEEDLDAASKDIMATIDEDGDGDVTKDAAASGIKYFEISIDPFKFISKVLLYVSYM